MKQNLDLLKKALDDTPASDTKLQEDVRSLIKRRLDLDKELNGDSTLRNRNENTPPSLAERVQNIVSGHWTVTSAPTGTQRAGYDIAATEFEGFLQKLRALDQDFPNLREQAEAAGTPWTPGKVPDWKKE